MTDFATPNLPSADFDRTADWYGAMGFAPSYRDRGWMILKRGALALEFFSGKIDPKESWFGACLRVDDLDALFAAFETTGVSRNDRDIPRFGSIRVEASGIRIFYAVDPDGTLLRCIDNAYGA